MSEVTSRGIEILMVEDNPADARLAVEAMKEAKIGNHMTVVADGEEALDFLRRRGRYANAPTPDLVLLDLNLPRKDGREVLAEIKSDPRLKRIPVVVLTTSRAEADVLKAYDLHANCFITKPVEADELLGIVRTIDQFWLSVVKLPGEEPQ
jgi:CheY-like chemotaxis protein